LIACYHVTDATVIEFAKGCPLKQVRLQRCKEITDTGIIQLAEHCPDLTYLDLRRLDLVSDEGVLQAIRKCTSLTALDVGGLDLKEPTFRELAKCCPRLVAFGADRSDNITNKVLIDLSINCPRLETLKLEKCKRITPEAMITVCNNASRLTWLNLFGCCHFDGFYTARLARSCSQLTSLNINCPNLTKDDLSTLLEGLLFLRKLEVRFSSPSLTEADLNHLRNQYQHLTIDMRENENTERPDKYVMKLKGW